MPIKRRLRKVVLISLIALFISALIPTTIKAQFEKPVKSPEETSKTLQYVPGEVLVKFKEGADPQAVLQGVNLESKRIERVYSIKPAVTKFKKDCKLERDSKGWYWFLGKRYKEIEEIADEEVFEEAYRQMSEEEKSLYRAYKISLPEGISVEEAILELKKDPAIEYVQPNYLMKIYMMPNDPYYHSSNSWGQDYSDLWGLKPDKLNCEVAWDISQGEGVIAAVVDTGIDYNHADIAANIWINNAEFNGKPAVDDDGNGYIDDIRGWDFSGEVAGTLKPDNDPMDNIGHGTPCSGIIAATGNNGRGIIGIAPKAKVMPVKMFPNSYTDIAVKAMKYALDNGAKVLNCSWGPAGRTISNPILKEGVDFAYSLNCTVVFAAGNNSDNVSYYFPAGYSKVITVAATGHNDERASFSNWGNTIDVAAPGGDNYIPGDTKLLRDNILSLRANGTDIYGDAIHIVNTQYYRAAGTSMACPHAAGVAALVKSKNPSLGPEAIKRILCISADDKGQKGFDKYYGFGRVNAHKALSANSISYLCARIRKPDTGWRFGRFMQISGTALASNFSYYTIEVGKGEEPSSWTTTGVSLTNNGTSQITDGILGAWSSSSFSDGAYTIRLKVVDSGGAFREHRVSVFVNNFIEIGWPQETLYGCSSYVDSPIMADIDNDGDSEVIAGAYEGFVYAWHDDGIPVDGWPVYIGGQALTPAAGDLDGDGYLEIVVGTNSVSQLEKLFVFQYDGTSYPGDWPKGWGPDYDWEVNYISDAPTLADLDNDGNLEIIVGGEDSNIHAWHNDGSVVSGWPVSVEHSQNTTTPAAGDIDGDGRLEIVAAESTIYGGEAYGNIYAWNDDGTRLSGSWPVKIKGTLRPPVIGDIDGDSKLEVVVMGCAGLFAFEGNGSIMPGWPKTGAGLSGSSGGVVSLGDLDGDGVPEVVAVDEALGKVWAFNGDGATFGSWPYKFSFVNPAWIYGTAIGDIDADKKQEVVISAYDSYYSKAYLFVLENNGQLKVGYPMQLDIEHFSVPPLGDLDGDKDLEMAAFGRWDGYFPTFFYVYSWNEYKHQDDIAMDWPMFHHDPQHTGRYTPSQANKPPTASISSILPNPACIGDSVSFIGKGTDLDTGDTIAAYKWTSSRDGFLSDKASFTKNTLSVGTHTIAFEVQDNHGAWSDKATATLEIKPKPSAFYLSLQNGQTLSGDLFVTMYADGKPLPWFHFIVDGQYVGHNPWKTQYFKNGPHTVYGQSGLNKTVPITVNINNGVSYLPEIISPANGATVSGNVNICLKTEKAQAYYAYVYVNGKIIGGKDLYNLASPYYYLWNTTKLPNGEYEIKVRVYYFYIGAVASNSIKVTVNNSTIPTPTLNLTCPNPASKTVNAHISSSDDADFFAAALYVDGKLVGASWWLPCDIWWDTTKFANGNHKLHFRVYNHLLKKWFAIDRIITVRN